MTELKKIKSALISVFDKQGLDALVRKLNEEGVDIYSTGGTQKYIEDLGVSVTPVESLTQFPEILGGRVKTLHPKIFGGILSRRENESDVLEISEHDLPSIDLVVVDLYPFEMTLKSGAKHQDIIEKIDIGGISLIRAAAKNYHDVTCVSDKSQYAELVNILIENEGAISLEDRKQMAGKAFAKSSNYDALIANYLNQDNGKIAPLPTVNDTHKLLRYGENPHQKAWYAGNLDEYFDKLNGKDLSYNNLLDVDAAVNLMLEFKGDKPTFAILKHNNACGIASRNSILEAYTKALEADNISAFGGILISNVNIDLATAEKINELFFEVIIAPSYDSEALEILKSKKNRIILIQKIFNTSEFLYRTALDGLLIQEKNSITDTIEKTELKTKVEPSEREKKDLIFASKIAKHTKSNTIVLVKNEQLIGSGTGQTSRVDALKHAIIKANAFQLDLEKSVMASDAFFPFPDCVEIAHKAGISAVIQPGGSIRDKASIDYCNENDISMIFTSNRHFKH